MRKSNFNVSYTSYKILVHTIQISDPKPKNHSPLEGAVKGWAIYLNSYLSWNVDRKFFISTMYVDKLFLLLSVQESHYVKVVQGDIFMELKMSFGLPKKFNLNSFRLAT